MIDRRHATPVDAVADRGRRAIVFREGDDLRETAVNDRGYSRFHPSVTKSWLFE
jgi:hypothetical protein